MIANISSEIGPGIFKRNFWRSFLYHTRHFLDQTQSLIVSILHAYMGHGRRGCSWRPIRRPPVTNPNFASFTFKLTIFLCMQSELLITLYIVCCISILSSIFVTISILKFGHARVSTKLVLYLHIGQIIQDIVALPELYYRDENLCKVTGFFHMYSGWSNILAVAIMSMVYRKMFFIDYFGISAVCSKYCRELVFFFPLLTLLPFITDSYGSLHDSWCGITKDNGEFFYYFMPAIPILIGFCSLCCFIFTVIRIYTQDFEMGRKVLKSLGLYALVTIIFWIPRIALEMRSNTDEVVSFMSYLLVYLSGTFYCLIFCREKTALKLFEQDRQISSTILSDDESVDFGARSSGFNSNNYRIVSADDVMYSWEEDEDGGEYIPSDTDKKNPLTAPILNRNEYINEETDDA